MSDEKPGCLRFSLRTLFLLILVCVIPLSVLTRKLLYVASQKQAAAEIRESGGSVVFSYDAPPRAGGYPFVRSIRPHLRPRKPSKSGFARTCSKKRLPQRDDKGGLAIRRFLWPARHELL